MLTIRFICWHFESSHNNKWLTVSPTSLGMLSQNDIMSCPTANHSNIWRKNARVYWKTCMDTQNLISLVLTSYAINFTGVLLGLRHKLHKGRLYPKHKPLFISDNKSYCTYLWGSQNQHATSLAIMALATRYSEIRDCWRQLTRTGWEECEKHNTAAGKLQLFLQHK